MWFGYRFEKDDGVQPALERLAAINNAGKAHRFWNQEGEPEVKTSDIGFAQPGAGGRPKVFIAEDRAAHELKSVPLHKMVAQQPTVVRSKVVEKINKPYGSSPPVVHHAPDGNYYVEDGHHRVAAAMLRGRKTITAVVHRWQDGQSGLTQSGALPGQGGA
jgi:hypothetical protein